MLIVETLLISSSQACPDSGWPDIFNSVCFLKFCFTSPFSFHVHASTMRQLPRFVCILLLVANTLPAQGVIVLTPSNADFLGLYALSESGESFDGMSTPFQYEYRVYVWRALHVNPATD